MSQCPRYDIFHSHDVFTLGPRDGTDPTLSSNDSLSTWSVLGFPTRLLSVSFTPPSSFLCVLWNSLVFRFLFHKHANLILLTPPPLTPDPPLLPGLPIFVFVLGLVLPGLGTEILSPKVVPVTLCAFSNLS